MRTPSERKGGHATNRVGADAPAWAALGAAALLCVVLGWRPLFSPDVGFYLSYGRSIAETGSIPFADALTFTRAGTPLGLVPWLFSLLSWWGYRAGGPDALILTTIALHLAVLAGLAVLVRRREGRLPVFAGVLSALFALGSLHEYRPHLVSWLALVAVLLCLDAYDRGHARKAWAIPAILAVWVNLHSLFVLGLVVLGIHVLANAWTRGRIDRRLLAVAAVSAASCFLTPYWAAVASFPVRQFGILSGGLVTSDLVGTAEFLSPLRTDLYSATGRFVLWQPALFVHAYLALVVVSAVLGWRRWTLRDRLLLIAFGWIFVRAMKNHGYFFIATFPAAVAGLDAASARLRGRVVRWFPGALAAATVAAALVVAVQVGNGYWYGLQRAPHRFGGGLNEAVLPVKAADFLRERVPGPVPLLNQWDGGGWVGFATRWPVFIDGRNEVMGEAFYREYLALKTPDGLPRGLGRWGIRAALVPTADLPQWTAWFLAAPDWRWVHHDAGHAVFVHRSLAVDAPDVAPSGLPSYDAARADAILAEARRRSMPSILASLTRRHHEPTPELRESLTWLRAGRPDAALLTGLAGLERATFPAPELLATVGHALWDLGQRDRARACFEAALRDVDDPLARERLASRRGTR
jgi:hypothetical protein